MANWQVICDFDGTMVDIDVTDALLDRFADSRWMEIEEEWLAGKIGSRECMGRQVALIRAPLAEINAFLDSVALDPDFTKFAALCAQQGIPLTVVSDGIDYAIYRILRNHKVSAIPVIANELLVGEDGGYSLRFPYAHPDCLSGVCKCHAAKQKQGKVLLVGDGRSDFCLGKEADFIFARKKLLAECLRLAWPHAPCQDFTAACVLLRTLPLFTQ